MPKYNFLPDLVLRTPIHSFKPIITEKEVRNLLQDDLLLESIYLSSPSLFKAILELNKGSLSEKDEEKVIISVTKYILRSFSRPTPFGLFAGNSVTKWGPKTHIKQEEGFLRKTELDFSVLTQIYDTIKNEPQAKINAKFYPNSSYYILHDQIRYTEKIWVDEHLDFQISAITKNEYILAALSLAENGATLHEIAALFVGEEVTQEEALAFASDLVDTQILVSELEPDLCSSDKIAELLDLLHQNSFPEVWAKKINTVKTRLKELDLNQINKIARYTAIERLFNAGGQRAFHVESFFNLVEGHAVDTKLQPQLLNAIYVLNTLKSESQSTDLETFKIRFDRRFGKHEVPLLIALDTEKGIGYGDRFDTSFAPLITEIDLDSAEKEVTLSPIEFYLEQILDKAQENGHYEIKLENEALPEINKDLNLSTTSPVIFKLVAHDQVVLEAVGGSSAINLICRFGNAFKEIGDCIDKIAHEEITANPNIIFTEILHVPNPKLGNVLSRKQALDYEMNFLSKNSNASKVSLRDIHICLENNTLYLKHTKTGQYIIPRLSNTHNVDQNSLPVYKFLFDFQYQAKDRSLKFQWPETIKEHSFFPRVSYNGVILSLATWKLDSHDLKTLSKVISEVDFFGWKQAIKLPDLFVISEGDNDLYINTNSSFLMKLFLDTVKSKKDIILKEFLFDESIPVKSAENLPKVNQFVASIIKRRPNFKTPNDRNFSTENAFVFFPEIKHPEVKKWLYIKLYCPPSSVDDIFETNLSDLIEKGLDEGLIDKWFFIRYRDPDFHLRLRFHLTEDHISFIKLLQDAIDALQQLGHVWKLENDHYIAEIERYSTLGIKVAEDLFFRDSMAYLMFIKNIEPEIKENTRWLYALRAVDDLLEIFNFSLKEKLNLITSFREGFFIEYGINPSKKRQIDKLYRENREEINAYLSKKSVLTEHILEVRKNGLSSFKIDPITDKEFVFGLTHMSVNRTVTIQPRLHEFLIYDFLFREYQSQIARLKKK